MTEGFLFLLSLTFWTIAFLFLYLPAALFMRALLHLADNRLRVLRLMSFQLGPRVPGRRPTRRALFDSLRRWTVVGAAAMCAALASFLVFGLGATGLWFLSAQFFLIASSISGVESLILIIRIVFWRNGHSSPLNEAGPPNYSINPPAGGTVPADSPRRAFARRGLCVR